MKCVGTLCALLALLVFVTSLPTKQDDVEVGDLNWWKTAVFYQIYPRSFMDSNNDGTGDLKGIINRLPHLASLGVTAVWLSPIYASPMADFGYDISDFRAVDPKFGTMADFEQFVKTAKELNLKIIMDFVPNHSSDEHEWFIKASENDPKFLDYYVWADGKVDGEGKEQPPTNWISYFHGSAWTKVDGLNKYYLHQFHVKQPDLNFRNPKVVDEMKAILTFWMEKGVDGFRVDTVPSLVEATKGDDGVTFEDEELSNNDGCTPNDRCFLKNVLQSDQPGTFDVVYELRKHLDEYTKAKGGDARIMMTEAYTSLENIKKYYQKDDLTPGAHFSFNFRFITDVFGDSKAVDIVRVINEWNTAIDHQKYTHNWVLGNHDQHRLVSRFGPERADGMIMLQMILPGVAVTYMGEEIGMRNGEVSYEDGLDPQGCDSGSAELFAQQSRDFERTPFQWDNSTNAGFNSGKKPWLPVGSEFKTVNVLVQQNVMKSPLEVYKSLIGMRSMDVIQNGEVEVKTVNDDNVVQVVRFQNGNFVIFLMNLGDKKQTVDLTTIGHALPNLLMVYGASRNSQLHEGSIVPNGKVTLISKESFILGA